MTHIALYRKWRPQVFDDLVGQEHISKTLLNAIKNDRISHAYLFCGPRGTGKTTTARILAKTLNCENRVNLSPCNECQTCKEMNNGSSLDVIEIDAASNRGISEIKNIIEQVRFASVGGNYKVYIIDEFHMLTTEAFNAILKTLEEPPPKVVFILATTESHKVLPTIISRCQRFDFQRIPVSTLVNRLKFVSDQENIQLDNDGILAIARKANGGLRDALSLLDQISSFSLDDGKIPADIVYGLLGMVSSEILANLAESIAKQEHVKILNFINDLLKSGNDPIIIITETINFFRHMLIVKNSPEMAEYLEVPVVNLDNIKRISELFSTDDILYILNHLNETIERVKKTSQAQLWLEINFVQLCNKDKKINNKNVNSDSNETSNNQEPVKNFDSEIINNLVKKINFLEKQIRDITSGNISINVQNTNTGTNIKNTSAKATVEQRSENRVNPNNSNLKDIWEKILIETKKKSIPAGALLVNGKLSHIDNDNNTIIIRFENEGFIEMIKRSKYQKIEQAFEAVFGKPYKLLMEKFDMSDKQNINNQNTFQVEVNQQSIEISDDNEHFGSESELMSESEQADYEEEMGKNESTNELKTSYQVFNENKPDEISNPVQETAEVFHQKVTQNQDNSPEEDYNLSENDSDSNKSESLVNNEVKNPLPENNEINPENGHFEYSDVNTDSIVNIQNNEIKEDILNYNTENSDNSTDINKGNNGSDKKVYFNDVADIFKGKIINNVKI